MSGASSPQFAVLQHAVQRGYVTPDQARALFGASSSGEGGVLQLLTPYLLPEQLEELRTLYLSLAPQQLLPERAPGAGGRIGDYLIERELARGGMGVVYVARHVTLGRRVAIKRMLAQRANYRGERRFQTEARVVAALRHPGIVKLHEIGVEGADPFIVMDLIEGESLADKIEREGPLEPRLAALLARDLARALQHAHEQGVLHRDLKPANVLLDAAGRALLTDFGLAQDLTDERERLTRTGQMVGTPAFMSPEQARGEAKQLDARTDVYGLGATLYAALSGRGPFEAASPIALIALVSTGTPERLARVQGGVPTDLEAVVMRALAPRREQRYESAAALAEDLDRFLAGQPVAAPRLRPRLGRAVLGLALCALVGAGLSLAPPAQPSEERRAPTPSLASVSSASPTPTPEVTRRRSPQGEAWLRQVGGLRDARLLPNGLVLAVGRRRERIWIDLIDRAAREPIARWTHHDDLTCLAISRRGERFALGTDQGNILFGSLEDPRPRLEGGGRRDRGGSILDLCFNAKGDRVLVSRSDTDAHTASVPGAKRKTRLPGTEESILAALAPKGRRAALCTEGNRGNFVEVWSMGKKKRTRIARHPSPGQAASLCFAPGGALFAVGDENGGIVLYAAKSGEVLGSCSGAGLETSEMGQWLAKPAHPPGHRARVAGLAFSPDGRRLYSLGLGRRGFPPDLVTWEVATRQELSRVPLEQRGYHSLSANADDLLLVAIGSETIELRAREP